MIRSLMFALLAMAGMSAARAQDVNLVDEQLSEKVYDSARSSGVAVVGAQALANPADGDGLQFAFYLPGEWTSDLICVSTEAADGLYNGRGTFRISGRAGEQPGELRTADYPTSHAGRLRDFGARQLAIAVRSGECRRATLDEGMSEETALELTLAYWRPVDGKVAGVEKVELLVNPFDAQQVRASIAGLPVPCEPIDVPVAASYAMSCGIDVSALGTSPATIRLQTLVPGQTPQSSFVRLHFPTP